MICPYCESEISDSVLKCQFCGEWVKKQEDPPSDEEDEIRCIFCAGEVSPTAKKCRHCGEWLDEEAGEGSNPEVVVETNNREITPVDIQIADHPPSPTTQNVNLHVNPESPVFAVITMLCYIFLYPVGLLLNGVGFFTGPRRGCFLSLFILFALIPGALVLAVVYGGVQIGIPFVNELISHISKYLP